MKPKLFTGIALVVALSAGLWSWLHHRPASPVKLPPVTAVEPVIVSQPFRMPVNSLKMVTVMAGQDKNDPSVLPLPTSHRSAIQKLVDNQVAYAERLKAIQSLSGQLSEADWFDLKPFLLQPDSLDRIQLGQVIKNVLLDKLCALNPPPADLGDVLSNMFQNQGQETVIRDYAVQHLGAYYEQVAGQGNNAQIQAAVQNTLWAATLETSDSIGGTALLALTRLSREYDGFDQGKIAATALQLAKDDTAGELTHITAFQVCAQLGVTNALPVVLTAAQKGETVSVQLSAIGTLGQVGGPDQIPFLKSLLVGPEERLKPAAQHALYQISLRQNQLVSRK